jgi:hypothetical protein
MTRTIHVETELPTNDDKVWEAMKQPASFLYVTRGLVGFPPSPAAPTPSAPAKPDRAGCSRST